MGMSSALDMRIRLAGEIVGSGATHKHFSSCLCCSILEMVFKPTPEPTVTAQVHDLNHQTMNCSGKGDVLKVGGPEEQ